MGLELTKAIGPIAGMIGGPVLANLFAPEGQELSSFADRKDHPEIDPATMLSNVNALIGRIGGAVTDRAASPVSLPSAFAQQPPVFSGGGMPMPIGVSGQDPALADPSLLSLQGLDQFKGIFDGMDGMLTGKPQPDGDLNDSYVKPDGYHADVDIPVGDRYAQPKDSASTTTRRKPAQLVRGADLLAEDEGQVDDMDRATAAIKLLMQNIQ